MNKSIRSDSSAALRTHLKTNLASLPEISTKVSLNSYIRYCHNLYCGAKNAYNQGDLRRAYVDLYKFQVLALQKIPTHKDFKVKAIDTAKQKAWLENTKRPALELLETVVYKLDQEEDIRLLHHQDFELMDEFDTPYNEEAAHPLQQPPPSITTNSPSRSSAALSVLTKLQQVPAGEVLDGAAVLPSQYVVPDFDFPDEAESEDAAGAASGAAPASGVVVGGLTIMDRAMLSYLGDGRRFAIPQPSTTTIDVQVGPSKHLFFLQDDFHTSFAGFLAALPPELQLSRPAVEMNRYGVCSYLPLLPFLLMLP